MTIEQKLQQMYAALRGMELKDKLPMIQPQVKRTGNQDGKVFDLNQVADGATAANQVSLLLNNVACLKDHLKAWGNKNGKPFTGEDLIKKNRDVPIAAILVDEHCNSLGSLEDIVLRAVTAWEAEFVRTGVTSNPS